jgi:hypothetical protein
VDITTSVDTVANVVCGTTTHFSEFIIGVGSATGVGDMPLAARSFALHQNVPNPFNPTTSISYDVPAGGGDVVLAVYDVSGRLVKSLVDAREPAGTRTVRWDGTDRRGQSVASGIYFYRMRAGSYVETRKMLLLK